MSDTVQIRINDTTWQLHLERRLRDVGVPENISNPVATALTIGVDDTTRVVFHEWDMRVAGPMLSITDNGDTVEIDWEDDVQAPMFTYPGLGSSQVGVGDLTGRLVTFLLDTSVPVPLDEPISVDDASAWLHEWERRRHPIRFGPPLNTGHRHLFHAEQDHSVRIVDETPGARMLIDLDTCEAESVWSVNGVDLFEPRVKVHLLRGRNQPDRYPRTRRGMAETLRYATAWTPTPRTVTGPDTVRA